MSWLSGKKTYILGILLALITIVWHVDRMVHDDPKTTDVVETGWMSDQAYLQLAILLGGGSQMMLRSGIAGIEGKK